TVERYDFLQNVLSVDKPSRLEFSHLKDRYYLAIPTGDLDFEEFKMNGTGTITFVIPDGVAHSTSYKRVQNYTQDGNKLTFQIENNGNTPALPIITVKHKSENGYIGIANKDNVFALGSEEEEDGTIVNRNEVLFDYSKAIAQSLEGAKNVGVLNYQMPTYDTELKRMRLDNIAGSGKGGEYVVIGKRGTTAGYIEHEGTVTWDIAPDSNGQYTMN
ncbi:distal tail protein Dit, partial [Arthrospira platensis SPKY2]